MTPVELDHWRTLPAAQQPEWPDSDHLRRVCEQLVALPPLVAAHEVTQLTDRLAGVSRGEAFLLQGGDCAETFAANTAAGIRDKVKTLLQMAAVLTYGASMPVVKVGRIAGQYAKPRSSNLDASGLPSYRGDAVNDIVADPVGRQPDPDRLMRVYSSSAATLNLVRAFATGGFSDLRQVHAWNRDFVARSAAGERYERMADDIERALAFMRACGLDLDRSGIAQGVELYSSHEALLLDYESALTRTVDGDPSGTAYVLSAHTVWIGERTRQTDGAHVEFLSKVANPIGLKVGPSTSPDDIVALASKLDPERTPGRLTVISRMGASKVRESLSPLIGKLTADGWNPVWSCDPMHGNTFEAPSGYKTRSFDDVMDEVRGFFEVHAALGTHPGGLHIELTGEDVTECLGGGEAIADGDLKNRYETACDPRLNTSQSLELAFLVAEMLQSR